MGRYGPRYSPASVVSSVSDDRGGGTVLGRGSRLRGSAPELLRAEGPCHPSLGQRPRCRIHPHPRGLKARFFRARDRAGLQPSSCFCGVVLGRCPQAEMGRTVGAQARWADTAHTTELAEREGGGNAKNGPSCDLTRQSLLVLRPEIRSGHDRLHTIKLPLGRRCHDHARGGRTGVRGD